MAHATIRLSRSPEGPWTPFRVRVGGRVSSTIIPRKVLEGVGIEPRHRWRLKTRDGRVIQRDVGDVFTAYRNVVFPSRVVFGEEGDDPVLGFVTMQELLVRENPATGRLRRVKVLLHPSSQRVE